MRRLLETFWQICMLRLGPQDLPASPFLLGLVFALYGALSMLVGLVNLTPPKAVLAALADMALLAGLLWVLLWVRALGARYTQTLTALAGSGVLLTLAALPPVLWQQQLGNEPGFTLPGLLLLGIMGWSLVVTAHILRHTLSTTYFMGAILAAVYGYVSIRVMGILFFS